MRKSFAAAVGAMVLAGLIAGPAAAQQATQQTTQTTTRTDTGDVVGPHNPYCGAWVNGVFQPNGNCVTESTTTTTTTAPAPGNAMAPAPGAAVGGTTPRRYAERISGRIINVNGHMVTLQHGDRTLIVDDSRALDLQDTGRVATGRDVVAHGYWEGDVFYARSFE